MTIDNSVISLKWRWMLSGNSDFEKKIFVSVKVNVWFNNVLTSKIDVYEQTHSTSVAWSNSCGPTKINGLWHGSIIGPFFFGNAEEDNISLNSFRHITMLTEFIRPKLDNVDISELLLKLGSSMFDSGNVTLNFF